MTYVRKYAGLFLETGDWAGYSFAVDTNKKRYHDAADRDAMTASSVLMLLLSRSSRYWAYQARSNSHPPGFRVFPPVINGEGYARVDRSAFPVYGHLMLIGSLGVRYLILLMFPVTLILRLAAEAFEAG